MSGALSRRCMISINFILWTGLKKCMPATRDGRRWRPASSVMLNADVFVAISPPGGAAARCPAISDSLRSIRSGAASYDEVRLLQRVRRGRWSSIAGRASRRRHRRQPCPARHPCLITASIAARPLSSAGAATSIQAAFHIQPRSRRARSRAPSCPRRVPRSVEYVMSECRGLAIGVRP